MRLSPVLREFLVPFTRHLFEAVGLDQFRRFTLRARINPTGNLLARTVAPISCGGQRDLRIGTEGKPLLSTCQPKLEPPPLAAVRGDDKKQPPFIEQLV